MQKYCQQKEQKNSSVESDLLGDELRSAREFIRKYRQKVLNLDKSYKTFYENNYSEFGLKADNDLSNQMNNKFENQFYLTGLKHKSEHTMYLNDIQSKKHQEKENRLNNDLKSIKMNQKNKLHQLGRYFDLKSSKKIKKPDSDQIYHLNQVEAADNQQLIRKLSSLRFKYAQDHLETKEDYELNRRYDRRLSQLGERLDSKFDNRYEYQLKSIKKIEDQLRKGYFKQNFCNCKKNNHYQHLNNKVLEPLLPFSMNNNNASDSQYLRRENLISNEMRVIDNESTNYDTDSEVNSSNLNHINQDLFFEDDDDYLDVYTIGSADSFENPISTENFTKLIRRLTYQDEMRFKLLDLCNQQNVLDFDTEFSKEKFPNVLNLDSGTFAVTFLALDANNNLLVLKMIRTISKDIQSRLTQLNYSGTETFDEVYNEIMISKSLSSLHDSKVNKAHCFPKILFTKVVKGHIPDNFIINKEKPKSDKDSTLEEFIQLINESSHIRKTQSENLNDSKAVLKQEPFKMFPGKF